MRPQIVANALLASALLALGACSSKTEPAPATHAALRRAAAKPTASIVPATRRQSLPPRRIGGVAQLADHGTLVDYAKTKPSGNGAYSWYPVSVSEAHAIAAIARGDLDLTAPDGTPIHLRYDRHIEHPDGNWTWVGRPEGATAGNEAIITFGPEAVFGTIPTRDGAPLRLTTVQGRTWMMATDAAAEKQLANTERRETDGLLPPAIAGRRASASGSSAASRTIAAAPSTAAAASAANTVDVLVGYTPEMAARFGSQSGANTRITFLVDVTNQAYTASQVDAAVRLVATMQVSYTETNSNAQALYNLSGADCVEQTDGSLDCNDAPVPAGLQPLVNARAQYGADVVALVRTFHNTEQEGCGIAWLLGGGQSTITQSDSDFAFAVVSDSNGDGGNSYPSNNRVCRDEAFAHELGHIMGAQHDRDTAAGDDGQLTSGDYGRFAYSFGYRGGPASVYTVMAYGAAGQGKVRVFSNPNVMCSPSPNVPAAPCGIADQADNARSLRQTIPVIAAFRASVSTPTRRFPHDFDGNRREDFAWFNPNSLELYTWFMSGGVPVIGQTGGYAFLGTQPGAVNDFNGDGFADILLVGADHVYMYTGNGAGGFAAAYVGARPAGYSVLAAADYDADGKADVIWYNASNGTLRAWRMNGSTLVQSVAAGSVIGGTTPLAVADFGGDGRADIVLGSTQHVYMLVGSSTGFAATYVTPRPVGWTLLSSDDANSDLKSDLTWFNPGTRELYYWIMDGATPVVGRGGNFAIAGTAPMTTGDYNGDGRLDIVLGSTDHLYMLSGNAAGNFDAAYVAGRPGGWSML
jgi:hypothetical protein